MNSLTYKPISLPLYILLLKIWIDHTNKESFNLDEMINFIENRVEQNDQQIIFILGDKNSSKLMRSSKININYMTIFKNNENFIPLECFELLKRCNISFISNKFMVTFLSESDYHLYLKWKGISTINKFIYDNKNGTLKSLIKLAIENKIIWEIDSLNKINPYIRNSLNLGTVSHATKQYGYNNSDNDLLTIINTKYYIDFYDIYSKDDFIFLENLDCINNIEDKIKKNPIVKAMADLNIEIEQKILYNKIEEIFFTKD